MNNNPTRYFISNAKGITDTYLVESGYWHYSNNYPQLLHRLYKLCDITKDSKGSLSRREGITDTHKWIAVSYIEGRLEEHLDKEHFMETNLEYLELLISYEV